METKTLQPNLCWQVLSSCLMHKYIKDADKLLSELLLRQYDYKGESHRFFSDQNGIYRIYRI